MAKDRAEGETFHEEVPGHRLIKRIKELIAEGNARAVRVTTSDGKVFLEVPLTPAAVTGGLVTLAVPWLAVLTTIAAVVAHFKVQIIQEPARLADEQPPAQRPAAERRA